MGGDNIITHEQNDRLKESLVESLMDERLEELMTHMDEDDPYLSPEWITTIFRLRDIEKEAGRSILTPDVLVHASLESYRMKSLDFLELSDIPNLSDSTIVELQPQARIMYQGHSGIHNMLHRQDRLEAAGAIFLRSLDIGNESDMYACRIAANMYEELAWYDMFKGEVGSHHEIAVRLNEQVAAADDTFSTQYKIHARMSLHDLKAIDVLAKHNSEPNRRLYRELRDLHLGYNDELIEISTHLDEYIEKSKITASNIKDVDQHRAFQNHWYGRATSATGTLIEGMTLSVLQGHILGNQLYDRHWAMQAFMRQDTMGRRKIEISPDKDEKLAALNITFDLQVFNFSQPEGALIPIEVKKKEPPGLQSLHPDIAVARLNIQDSPGELTETVRKFAVAQSAKLLRQDLTRDQAEMHSAIIGKVNPVKIFERLY